MTIPSCLPLLGSRPVPAARRAGAAARERGKRCGGFQPAPADPEIPVPDWSEAAFALFQILSLPDDDPAIPSYLSDLVGPAGARLGLALLGLAEESAEDLADFVDHVALRVELADRRPKGADSGTVAVALALRGDAYRRCNRPEPAEAAFERAFQALPGSANALAFARIEDLYARLERERGALGSASEGFVRALGAYESVSAMPAAVDTAVRLASVFCEAGQVRSAEDVCARVRSYWPGVTPGAQLVREAARFAARGRDAAAGQIQRIAEKDWMGGISILESRDLEMLRFDQLAKRFVRRGPNSEARLVAATTERLYAQFCRAERLFGAPETRGLHWMSQFQMNGTRSLPADLVAALTYFAPAEPPHRPIFAPQQDR